MESELRYLVRLYYRHQQRELATCHGKPAFSNRKHAQDSLPRNGRVTPYRCEICRKWHVGSHLSTAARERRPARVIGVDEEVRR